MLARSRCAPRGWWGTTYETICFESSPWMKEGRNEWINERMNETNESINEWINGWLLVWMNQWNLPTSSSKSALWDSGTLSFLRFLCETELSLQSHAHFADLISQKCSERDGFWKFSSANRALATSLVRILLASFFFLNIFKCKSSSR